MGAAGWRTRAERVRQAQELRALGFSRNRIAEKLGVSFGTVCAYFSDPDLSGQATRRRRYAAEHPCQSCGRPTDGSRGHKRSARFCADCAAEAKRHWTREAVTDAIRRYAAAQGRPPNARDWDRADPARGYPSKSTVYRSPSYPNAPFARWADAIEAAGFPRPTRGSKYASEAVL